MKAGPRNIVVNLPPLPLVFLITTAISLVPEAVEVCAQAGWFMLGGYMLLYLITFSFRNDAPLGLIWAPVIGIGFHSFIDGLQYGVLYEIDTQTGMAASAGLIAHEFAEGVILFSILQRAGLSNRVAFLGGFVGAALTTPLGRWWLKVKSIIWVQLLLAG